MVTVNKEKAILLGGIYVKDSISTVTSVKRYERASFQPDTRAMVKARASSPPLEPPCRTIKPLQCPQTALLIQLLSKDAAINQAA